MAPLPSGTVTFLFTDIEGSTRLWEEYPQAMPGALARHDALLRFAIEREGGYIFKLGGDAFCAAFQTAPAALHAVLAGQRALQAEAWGETGPIKVRMALHSGVTEQRDGDYIGPALNRLSRLLNAGHGGQILVSQATRNLLGADLPADIRLHDLGERRLRDLRQPEHIFQVLAPDLPAEFPPLKTVDLHGAPPSARNRQRLLEKVRSFWIDGVLEQSLHGAVQLELDLATHPQAVERPWELVLQQPSRPDERLPPGTPLVAIFERLGGEVLILGAPGAGKTTTLLALTRVLLERAERDPALPVPVVFTLAAWAERQRPLADWLVEELGLRYGVARKLARAWVAGDQILPLLDGLDEVRPAARRACVLAINRFREEHGLLGLVVTSRSADYEVLAPRLRLQGAIVLQPLTGSHIEQYLASLGPQVAALRPALQQDESLRELAQSPLMLNILVLAYHGSEAGMLQRLRQGQVRYQALFQTYIDRMLQRRGPDARYAPERTRHWLRWLAQRLAAHDQTELYLERMQPGWLGEGRERQRYRTLVRLALALLAGLVWGLAGLVAGGLESAVVGFLLAFALWPLTGMARGRHAGRVALATGLSYGLLMSHLFEPQAGYGAGMLNGAVIGVSAGLIYWLFSRRGYVQTDRRPHATGIAARVRRALGSPPSSTALASGLSLVLVATINDGITGFADALVPAVVFGIFYRSFARFGLLIDRIEPVEALSWSWQRSARGFVIGLLPSLVWSLVNLVAFPERALLSVGSIIAGVCFGILLGLLLGLTPRDIVVKASPNQGIWRSAKSALRIALLWGLASAPLIGVAGALADSGFAPVLLAFSLIISVPLVLLYGGFTCLQHLVLRLLFVRQDATPWDYVRFLDYATERILLRKVGGSYLFIHRLLLDFFAASSPRPDDAPAETNLALRTQS